MFSSLAFRRTANIVSQYKFSHGLAVMTHPVCFKSHLTTSKKRRNLKKGGKKPRFTIHDSDSDSAFERMMFLESSESEQEPQGVLNEVAKSVVEKSPERFMSYTPKQIVSELDKYIIGQADAKRAVAVAMRARWRRQQLDEELQKEVHPANILLVGPTGSGKTEIARRVANLSDSPFIKVEATRYTEVGFVGPSVDSIIKELVDAAFNIEKKALVKQHTNNARESAANQIAGVMRAMTDKQWDELTDKKWRDWVEAENEDLLRALAKHVTHLHAEDSEESDIVPSKSKGFDQLTSTNQETQTPPSESETTPEVCEVKDAEEDALAHRIVHSMGDKPILGYQQQHDGFRMCQPDPSYLSSSSTSSEEHDYVNIVNQLEKPSFKNTVDWILDGRIKNIFINIALPIPKPVSKPNGLDMAGGGEEMGMFITMLSPTSVSPKTPPKSKIEKVTVGDALIALTNAEVDKLIDETALKQKAIKSAEDTGIIFIDEIDKLARQDSTGEGTFGNKKEGVQKELLSLIEGTVINTTHGPVSTNHILFITSGAFYQVKPNDLLPELQGRLPIRVSLTQLTEAELRRVLVEPQYAIVKQQVALMKTEGLNLNFTEEGIDEIAKVSTTLNSSVENIGARRLTSVVSQVLQKVSFDAPEMVLESKTTIDVDKTMVLDAVKDLMKKTDLSKYTL